MSDIFNPPDPGSLAAEEPGPEPDPVTSTLAERVAWRARKDEFNAYVRATRRHSLAAARKVLINPNSSEDGVRAAIRLVATITATALLENDGGAHASFSDLFFGGGFRL
jgi:hypothetical protein